MHFVEITSDFENRSFRHFCMKLCAFCDQLMQVYIMLTPLLLFRSANFIPFLRTSGFKKSNIFCNKIKVKNKLLDFDNMHLYLHSECEFSMCFKFVFLQNVILRDF